VYIVAIYIGVGFECFVDADYGVVCLAGCVAWSCFSGVVGVVVGIADIDVSVAVIVVVYNGFAVPRVIDVVVGQCCSFVFC